MSSAGWDVHVLSLVYAGLTKENEKGDPVPALAESWEYNADGTSVTFTLRKGTTFSDGTPLDATAVKKSIERGRDHPKSLIAAQLANSDSGRPWGIRSGAAPAGRRPAGRPSGARRLRAA
ncbi:MULTISPECIES: ABC transporter substrate-binding protein [Streptomyces]|uniref:ABC transporter substrate-binding protein n=1 Tax=Streptomyces TaxID=1883 RepID=UPI001E2F559E|nr:MULTISPECIES: ABC transporter substrate-binding protein [Streptomyces]MCZ4101344.1 ABC transporter substrate-binding protein [Streptomyces sp. H39-C1]